MPWSWVRDSPRDRRLSSISRRCMESTKASSSLRCEARIPSDPCDLTLGEDAGRKKAPNFNGDSLSAWLVPVLGHFETVDRPADSVAAFGDHDVGGQFILRQERASGLTEVAFLFLP